MALITALRGRSPTLSAAARSQAIDFARITLIIGLVFLHYGSFLNSDASPYRGVDVTNHPLATYVNSLVLFFFFSVVPLLSAISGYLFFAFAHDAPRQIANRIKRRFLTLYAPLILWDLAYCVVLLLVSGDVVKFIIMNTQGVQVLDVSLHDYRAVEGIRVPFAIDYRGADGTVLASDRFERVAVTRTRS